MFGGMGANGNVLQDTWEIESTLSGFCWGQPIAPGSVPAARQGASMTYELEGGPAQLVLFGGVSAGPYSPPMADTCYFAGFVAGSVTSGSWTQCSSLVGPAARWGAVMSWTGEGVILFGGTDTSTSPPNMFAQTWLLQGAAWIQLSPQASPPALLGACGGFSGQTMVLFGGYNPLLSYPQVQDQEWVWSWS